MNEFTGNAIVFKAFCDESRLRIIELLDRGEACACILLEDLIISQSTLSHHMKILVDSGIVNKRKDGKRTFYSLSSIGIYDAKKILEKILDNMKNYAESPAYEDINKSCK